MGARESRGSWSCAGFDGSITLIGADVDERQHRRGREGHDGRGRARRDRGGFKPALIEQVRTVVTDSAGQ